MMDKKARYLSETASLLEAYTAGAGRHELEDYIKNHSQLPGPRGNLELAHGFADAVAAGVAEPELLKQTETADAALALHRRIMTEIGRSDRRGTEEFLVLRRALGYTFSVAVCALPAQGFAYLHELAASGDNDALWILKNNLKKARLVRDFPEETAAVLESLR